MRTMVGLRVALSDQPGALMRLAATIAEHGGNIISIDVHQSGTNAAVDDLTIDFPDDGDLDRLRTALQDNGAGSVLSHWNTQLGDPVVSALGYVAELVAQPPDPADDGLARAVGKLCGSPVAWVSSTADAVGNEAGRFAMERRGAIALRTTELPDRRSDWLPGEVWLLAVPDGGTGLVGRVVFVARALTQEFTTTEIARVEAFL
ncbi:MAG: ACT domain-containing protein, partial [Actinomycetota bacterium]|nr:ACT domain-containing protein [Actinomycetota bacterium]